MLAVSAPCLSLHMVQLEIGLADFQRPSVLSSGLGARNRNTSIRTLPYETSNDRGRSQGSLPAGRGSPTTPDSGSPGAFTPPTRGLRAPTYSNRYLHLCLKYQDRKAPLVQSCGRAEGNRVRDSLLSHRETEAVQSQESPGPTPHSHTWLWSHHSYLAASARSRMLTEPGPEGF